MEWHPYAMSFPLLTGYGRERVKASLKKHGQLHPITYRMKDGKKQGLDGRNREILLLELGKEPEYKKVFKDDHEVKEFIDSENWDRRHETQERQKEDREARIERVVDKRQEGQSTRAIAASEGVSESTVRSDLAAAGAQGCAPEPKDGKIIGSDGKVYKLVKPRISKKKSANVDAHGRKVKKPRKKKITAKTVIKDQIGTVVPDRLRDVFADEAVPNLIIAMESADAMMDPESWCRTAGNIVDRYPFLLIKEFNDHCFQLKESMQLAIATVKNCLPHAVCPKCVGVESTNGKTCRACRGGGYVPEFKLKEAQES